MAKELCFVFIVWCLQKTSAEKAKFNITDDAILNAFNQNKYLEYNKYALPPTTGGPVEVSLYPTLEQFITLDVEEQVMSVRIAMGMQWKDERIPQFLDALGVTRTKPLYMSVTQLWVPDIRLYNSVEYHQTNYDDVPVIVKPDGMITFSPDVTCRSFCKVDWDIEAGERVNCSLMFGSWAHSQDEINIKNDTTLIVATKVYKLNQEWKVTGHFVTLNKLAFDYIEEVYINALATLELERTRRNAGESSTGHHVSGAYLACGFMSCQLYWILLSFTLISISSWV